jgi:ribosomal-protein-alanine N-acetyltransferase
MSFAVFKELETYRLFIRPVSPADVADLLAVNGDDAVTQFLPYATWKSRDDGVAWYQRMQAISDTGTGKQLVLVHKGDKKVIGTVLLFRFDEGSARIELGYVIGRAHWRQGYAKEALQAVCDYAFKSMHIRRIEAEVDLRNAASNAVLKSLGFVKEGLLRHRWITKGTPIDTNIYGCLASEWGAQ